LLLGDFEKGNAPLPPRLNTFHPGAFRSVLNFGMAVTCTPKGPMVHSFMRRMNHKRDFISVRKDERKNKCLKLERGTRNAIQRISKGKIRGLECKKYRGKGISSNKHPLQTVR
jgi:hypothetical protein